MPTDEPDHRMDAVEYEFPVSRAQASLLVLERLYTGSAQYHVPAAFAVHGPFDIDAFTRALDMLVARHESLRTVFRTDGTEHLQVVAEDARAEVRVERGTLPGEVDSAMHAEATRPFDIETGPLLRCIIYALTDGSHRILLTIHHLVCDGWSMQIMLRELAVCYGTGSRPAALDPLPIQYPDYAAWQCDQFNCGGFNDAVAYWRELLSDAPTTLALPTDKPRPGVQSPAGGTEQFVLRTEAQERLVRVARERNTTAFAVLFAAFNAFLYRLSGQRDLVVGVPVSGRDHADLQGMVGMLTNTLALRTDVCGDPSFHELIERVRDGLGAAQSHQDAPFSAVIEAVAPERGSGHDPVVQVVFGYDDDTELMLDLPGARVKRVALVLDVAKFDFLMYVQRWGPDLVVQFNYRSDLFTHATVRHWARSFQVMLHDLLDQPDASITDADLLDPAQRHTILDDWNRTESLVPERMVPDLVAERAAERPDATALVYGDTVLTYRELLSRADRLATHLRAAGVGPEVPVGLCLPRSAEMAVAALAVLRAGGAYIPLDPEQPPARLEQMLTDAGARLVLASAGTTRRTAELGVAVAVLAEAGVDFVVAPHPVGPPTTEKPGPRNTAYILYTSGSTGTPKGVAVEHAALTNLATAVRPQFPVTTQDRVLQYVAFGFDVSVSDLFFTWVAGAELHIAGEHERLGDELYARLRDSRITYVFLPPSAAMSLPSPPGALPDLHTVAVGGEPCPPKLVERWSAPDRRLLDAYGPSEATVYATLAELLPHEPVVIGRPVANVRAYVLDQRLRPVPPGVVGEIYLAGKGLARGYADRPGPTAERFVADPFGPPGSRMYRTGDLGRYDANGVLSYLGRTDSQVKVRGFRVELGEIETVLASHRQVAAAAATVHGDAEDRRLAAYVVGTTGTMADLRELRTWLAARLPGYMVPETIMHLQELPLGRTGKVDRARLPRPPATRPDLGRPSVGPKTRTERRLAAIWAHVLELTELGVHDNFFELGGNSIRLLAVLTALRDQGEDHLTMIDLFRHPTISTLAAHLDQPTAYGPVAVDRAVARQRGQDRRERLAVLRAGTREHGDSTKGGTA